METTITSLPSAAYALAKGAKLLRCEPDQPGRVSFVFEDPQSNVSATAREFFTGSEVSARDYYRALQDIRLSTNRALSGVR